MALIFAFSVEEVIEEGRIEQSEIEKMKIWLSTEENIPMLAEQQIVHFLLACDKNKTAAQRSIKEFYKLKRSIPQFFVDRNVDKDYIHKIFRTSLSAVLPRTDDNCILMMHKASSKASDLNVYHMVEMSTIFLDTMQYDNPSNGLILVIDLKEVGIMHLTRLRYTPLRCIFSYIQDCIPLKIKAVHFINVFPYMDKFMAMISPFMKKEIYEVIQYHNSSEDEEFYKCVPKKCLPCEYGGDMPSFTVMQSETVQKLRNLKRFLDAEERQWHFMKL